MTTLPPSPAPLWTPSAEEIERARVTRLARDRGLTSYSALHRWSIEERGEFWGTVIDALGIRMRQPPGRVLDVDQNGTARWLPQARLNIVESCFQAPATAAAVIEGRPDGTRTTTSYGELRARVEAAATHFRPGERVALFLPMDREAVVLYLGVILAGGLVVTVAESFSGPELTRRLAAADVHTLVTREPAIRRGRALHLLERARSTGVESIRVVGADPGTRGRPGETAWDGAALEPFGGGAAGEASAHTHLLFSSGTTAAPKIIPWTQITPIKAAMDGRYHHDIGPGDVVCWPTGLGWMMGPWLIYASLLNGAALALYDDAPMDAGFVRFVRDAGVTLLGVVPSLVRRWRESGVLDDAEWGSVRRFSSTGEASNEDDMRALSAQAGGRPVLEYCGGTEIGGGYLCGTMVQPCLPTAFSTPALGMDLRILDEEGAPAERGEVFLVPPSIGLSSELVGSDHHRVYEADAPRGLRRHGDVLEHLGGGYYRALGRADDTMNLGGIKVSSVALERAVGSLPDVHGVAAVADDTTGPSALVLFVEVAPAVRMDWLREQAQRAIADALTPLLRVDRCERIESLPRTPSGKVMRRRLRERLRRGTRT